jgi:hypothetical protein
LSNFDLAWGGIPPGDSRPGAGISCKSLTLRALPPGDALLLIPSKKQVTTNLFCGSAV